jgi:hypothetical protein
VCCLNINEWDGGGGGLGMFNIDDLVKNKQIKFAYKIINSEMHSWNALGKHWLNNLIQKKNAGIC